MKANKNLVPYITDEELEAFADAEHERWTSWHQYVLSKSERTSEGTVIIPKELVDRWDTQCITAYADLSDEEKESDRKVFREYVQAIVEGVVSRFFNEQYSVVIKAMDDCLTRWQRFGIRLFDLWGWVGQVQKRADYATERLEHFKQHSDALQGHLDSQSVQMKRSRIQHESIQQGLYNTIDEQRGYISRLQRALMQEGKEVDDEGL